MIGTKSIEQQSISFARSRSESYFVRITFQVISLILFLILNPRVQQITLLCKQFNTLIRTPYDYKCRYQYRTISVNVPFSNYKVITHMDLLLSHNISLYTYQSSNVPSLFLLFTFSNNQLSIFTTIFVCHCKQNSEQV